MSENKRPNRETMYSKEFVGHMADHYTCAIQEWLAKRGQPTRTDAVQHRLRKVLVSVASDAYQLAAAMEKENDVHSDIALVDIFRDIELVHQRTFDYLLDKWCSRATCTEESVPAIGDIIQFTSDEMQHTGRVMETCPALYCCAVMLNAPYYGEICKTVNYEDIICNISKIPYGAPKVEEEAYPEVAVPSPVPTEPPKCICPDVPVLVKGGTNVAIDTIVDSKYTGAVVCWNKDSSMVEYQKVISYSTWAGAQIEAAASASVSSREQEPMPEKVKERLLGELAGWRKDHPKVTAEEKPKYASVQDLMAGTLEACQKYKENL